MKNSQYRKSKLLYELKTARKSNKETINLKILYRSDLLFLEERGHAIYPTDKKHWYEVEVF